MKLNEKTIFLLDGFGAFLSLITTVILLVYFSHWLGMSQEILGLLGLAGFVFSIYSLSCYFFVKTKFSNFLMGLICANSVYAVSTLCLAFFYSELTVFGKLYLAIDFLILLGLVALEIKIYRKN